MIPLTVLSSRIRRGPTVGQYARSLSYASEDAPASSTAVPAAKRNRDVVRVESCWVLRRWYCRTPTKSPLEIGVAKNYR